MVAKFRIQPYLGGRFVVERCNDRSVYGDIWRVIDFCDTEESAQDRLAVAERRMSRGEAARRFVARRKARKQTKTAA